MKKPVIFALALTLALTQSILAQESKSVRVELQNARRTIVYQGVLVVDGEELTLKGQTLTASGGNDIAVLVIGGGHLTLDACTIVKTGDGISQRTQNDRQARGGAQRRGGGGDDSFSFYGLNSAVVVVGEGSRIDLRGCTVKTDANQANAVFACDGGRVTITEGITIRTQRGGSRGLFATCAGIIEADGVVDIETKGAHCAALATDRGGGTVTVGHEGTKDHSRLVTGGEGSPCIYSTGDITAHNAEGSAAVSQTMVVEGRNSIHITDCNFTGHSPQHGGIMLYQSTSGDAREGTSTLTMKDCTIRDNSGTTMLLVTNTHSIVDISGCTFLAKDGRPLTADDALVVCRNCNADGRGHHWGREGSNGGQVDITLTHQSLTGYVQAVETESAITITRGKKSNTKKLQTREGKGQVTFQTGSRTNNYKQ